MDPRAPPPPRVPVDWTAASYKAVMTGALPPAEFARKRASTGSLEKRPASAPASTSSPARTDAPPPAVRERPGSPPRARDAAQDRPSPPRNRRPASPMRPHVPLPAMDLRPALRSSLPRLAVPHSPPRTPRTPCTPPPPPLDLGTDLWSPRPASLPGTPRRGRRGRQPALSRKRSLPTLPARRTQAARVPSVSLAEYAAAELPDLQLFVRALLPLFGRTRRPPRRPISTSSSGSSSHGRFPGSPGVSSVSALSRSPSSLASGFDSPPRSRPLSPGDGPPGPRLALPSLSTESLTDMEDGDVFALDRPAKARRSLERPAGRRPREGRMSREGAPAWIARDAPPPRMALDGVPEVDCTAPVAGGNAHERRPPKCPAPASLLLRSICDLYAGLLPGGRPPPRPPPGSA